VRPQEIDGENRDFFSSSPDDLIVLMSQFFSESKIFSAIHKRMTLVNRFYSEFKTQKDHRKKN